VKLAAKYRAINTTKRNERIYENKTVISIVTIPKAFEKFTDICCDIIIVLAREIS
jgi:hypothetical protein